MAARFAKPSLPSQHSIDDEPISVIDVDDEDTNIWDGPKLVLQRVNISMYFSHFCRAQMACYT